MWSGRQCILRTGLLAVTALFAACGSNPHIATNANPNVNFADFQTFGFMRPLSTDLVPATLIMGSDLIAATTRELESAGLRLDDDPDLLVDFFVSNREVTRAMNTPSVNMSLHRARYDTWNGYTVGMSAAQLVQSTDGTLAVDIVDRARKQLIWEGAATARITEDRQNNLQRTIYDAIADIFARFP